MKPFVFRVCLLLSVVHLSRAGADDAAKLEFFESRIRPVLVEHCYKCHAVNAKNVRGGLLLDSKAGALDGGESGAAVVPGAPEESLLLSALKHESYEMPPDRKLSDAIVADFEKWIHDGAVDPRIGGKAMKRTAIDLKEGRRFWSFRPVRRPDVPKLTGGWAKTDIDRFVAARQMTAGLSPVDDATAEQVLRRIQYALVGLPPTPDQIATFAAAWSVAPDAAIDALVDELLASPRFGERWGRHWLDVARFAESSGGGRSLMFPDAWRFRDYVIKSFNDDKPFDQLVREHIAGDLLPFENDSQHDDQVTGVGYLTLGPTNYEQQDKELLRMEVIDEQVDTIGRTFLGLTLGCARCHDHKFDPIPTADYYAMAGVFRSTETLLPGNVSTYVTTSLKMNSEKQVLADWKTKEKSLLAGIAELKKKVKGQRPGVTSRIDAASLAGVIIDDTQAKFEGEWVHSTSLAPFVGEGYRHDNFLKTGRSVRFETTLPESGKYRLRLAHNYQTSRCSRLPITVTHAKGSTTVEIDQRKTPVDGVFAELGTFPFVAGSKAVVTIDAEKSGKGVVIVDAVQFLPDTAADVVVAADEQRQQLEWSKRLTSLEAELKTHKKARPDAPKAMGVRDQKEPADWHIHVRGGIRNLGPIVPRGFVSAASPVDQNGDTLPFNLPQDQSGRLEMSSWIASPVNPLTSRVFVNRIWLHLIGEGLVRTPDNFGKMGRTPTHPELLDYLAATFVDDDRWSVKKLIRRIVMSRVFRLSSSAVSNADPDNVLLTRGFRRRLDVESLRDSTLQISGQLDLNQVGGRTIEKITQYDNAYDHDQFSRNIRSVYVPFFRNCMLEMFEVFDITNPNLVTGQRTSSTLPSQGLFLLNSPFMLEQSKVAAEHFLKTQSVDAAAVDAMIDDVFLRTLGRSPTMAELEPLQSYLTEEGADSTDAWASVFQALFASVDFRYID
ncbi:MAG: DUF1553 domain-containing protein [Fuerstiella sp.]|nr:DUF1553 domain-containing protein [Fuerstiella sp.]MCP4507439.1 DUF1553 domain-containing protein [Fuerstiella sp.]